MSVYTVIDKIEATIKEGVWMPFGLRMVSSDRLLDLIEKLRSNLPDEVSRAKAVTKEKDRLLDDARTRAASLLDEATTTKSQLLADSEIAKTAQEQANKIVAEAERQAKLIRRGAEEYADSLLASLDNSLGNALAAVHKGREQLASTLTGNGTPSAPIRRA